MATVGNTVRWCCFVENLCSEMEEREFTWLDYYCHHRVKVDQWRFVCKYFTWKLIWQNILWNLNKYSTHSGMNSVLQKDVTSVWHFIHMSVQITRNVCSNIYIFWYMIYLKVFSIKSRAEFSVKYIIYF
jgi:hypothetical protein